MENSKLIYALKNLDVYEFNRFAKFVNSPYFNVNQSLVNFLAFLERFLKKDKPLPSKQKIYAQIFPSKKYSDASFRKLSTDLLGLFEEFLSHELYYQKNLRKINNLLSSLGERKLDKLYNVILNKAKRYTENSYSKTSEFYYEQYSLQKNMFSLISEFERKAKSKKEISDFNIPQISYNLDLFYIIEKLRYACKVLSWKKYHSQDIKLDFVPEIIQIVENSALLRNRVVQIYYSIYKTYVDENNEKHYYKLKELLEAYLQIFPADEAKEIFEAAFSYCVNRINEGHPEFQSEIFGLYKKALETNILLIQGYLSPTTFRNIVTYGLRLKEFKWTEEFIEKYKSQLDPKYGHSVAQYNFALLSFYKKDYQKVLMHLREFDYDEINYVLGAKSIMLATYFELEEEEVLYSLFDSFKTYLDRKKEIPASRKKSYINLIKLTKKLLLVNRRDKTAMANLAQEISDTKILASKQWLLEKISSL